MARQLASESIMGGKHYSHIGYHLDDSGCESAEQSSPSLFRDNLSSRASNGMGDHSLYSKARSKQIIWIRHHCCNRARNRYFFELNLSGKLNLLQRNFALVGSSPRTRQVSGERGRTTRIARHRMKRRGRRLKGFLSKEPNENSTQIEPHLRLEFPPPERCARTTATNHHTLQRRRAPVH